MITRLMPDLRSTASSANMPDIESKYGQKISFLYTLWSKYYRFIHIDETCAIVIQIMQAMKYHAMESIGIVLSVL